MDNEIIFITGNKHKAEQVIKYLSIPVKYINLNLTEIQSLDLYEVVTYKVQEAYKKIKKPLIVEDTSLIFSALKTLPGPFIKWFHKVLGNKGLCQLLNNYDDRTALAQSIFAYYDGIEIKYFFSERKGTVADYPKGKSFGWDAIFIPEGEKKTYAEMNTEEKDKVSLRKDALIKISKFLKK